MAFQARFVCRRIKYEQPEVFSLLHGPLDSYRKQIPGFCSIHVHCNCSNLNLRRITLRIHVLLWRQLTWSLKSQSAVVHTCIRIFYRYRMFPVFGKECHSSATWNVSRLLRDNFVWAWIPPLGITSAANDMSGDRKLVYFCHSVFSWVSVIARNKVCCLGDTGCRNVRCLKAQVNHT